MTRARDVSTPTALVLISSTTVGTSVTSVTVTNAFSATYENYLVLFNGGTNTIQTALAVTLGTSVASYNGILSYGSFGTVGTPASTGDSSASAFTYAGGGDVNGIFLNATLLNPFLAKYTRINSSYQATNESGFYTGIHKVATSYTDLKITSTSGTMTGGTIRVYGYKN